MPLPSLSPVTDAAEARALLAGLRQNQTVGARVLEVERLVAFAARRLGPDYWTTFPVRRVLTGRGDIDVNQLRNIFDGFAARPEFGDAVEPFPNEGTAAALFSVGPVRFFQSPKVPSLQVTANRGLGDPKVLLNADLQPGGDLLSNERAFSTFYPAVIGIGGTVVGIGSFQNLSLAAVSEASGLILVDYDPVVTLTLTLILPQLARSKSPQEFVEKVRSLIEQGTVEPFFRETPDQYIPAFTDLVAALRKGGVRVWLGKRLVEYLDQLMVDPRSFLGNTVYFTQVQRLVEQGRITQVYADLFGPDMPDLLYAALSVYEDPIRTLYFSNALQRGSYQTGENLMTCLLPLLFGPWTDPEGRFLMTTLGGAVKAEDSWTYNALKTGDAGETLVLSGGTGYLIRHYRDNPVIVPAEA